MQPRSLIADGVRVTYLPGWQSVHAAQIEAFCCVEKVPLPQAAQIRSEIAVPPLVTDCPATQAVFGVQGVADLPSWSHVSVAQATFSAVPPAQ